MHNHPVKSYHYLLKINDGAYFIKAFKLLLDFDLMEVLIPAQYKPEYIKDKSRFDYEIFNLFLISQFLILNGNNVFTKEERDYIATNLLYLPFHDLSNYSHLDENKNSNFFIASAHKFCSSNDCKSNVLKEIGAEELKISIN